MDLELFRVISIIFYWKVQERSYKAKTPLICQGEVQEDENLPKAKDFVTEGKWMKGLSKWIFHHLLTDHVCMQGSYECITKISLCKGMFWLVIVGCSLLKEEAKVWSLKPVHSILILDLVHDVVVN